MVLRSISEWKELGKKPKDGQSPRQTKRRYGGGVIKLFDYRQVRDIRTQARVTPAEIEVSPSNVACAGWTVNRAAKRYRDAASSCYQSKFHGFARHNSETKSELYFLKDIAVAWLASNGHLLPERIHGSLCLWVGLGYSFHSTLTIAGVPRTDNAAPLLVEAKPRGKGELRLVDAKALLRKLDDRRSGFARLSMPIREYPSARTSYRHDVQEQSEEYQEDY